jgi:hypothetical protein
MLLSHWKAWFRNGLPFGQAPFDGAQGLRQGLRRQGGNDFPLLKSPHVKFKTRSPSQPEERTTRHINVMPVFTCSF